MDTKNEGIAFPPYPMAPPRSGETSAPGTRLAYAGREPRCEMCGGEVIATHCKRICLKCGFMTGCSEGI